MDSFLLPPHLKPSDLSKRCSVLESQTPINRLHQIENKWQVQKIEDFPLLSRNPASQVVAESLWPFELSRVSNGP